MDAQTLAVIAPLVAPLVEPVLAVLGGAALTILVIVLYTAWTERRVRRSRW